MGWKRQKIDRAGAVFDALSNTFVCEVCRKRKAGREQMDYVEHDSSEVTSCYDCWMAWLALDECEYGYTNHNEDI